MGRRDVSGGPSSRRPSRGHASAQKKRSKVNRAKAARILKSNKRKGAAFERSLTTAIKRTPGIRTKSVKTQVTTKSGGRADIVARTKSGDKIVVEAKNYNGNPITKRNVKKVTGYAKDLKAKYAVLSVSKTTKVPTTVRKYANRRKVTIMKC